MALAAASPFASFDITDKSQWLDISPVLSEALFQDLHFLESINMDFGSPVWDTTYTWNEDTLNSDQATVSGSVTSAGTTINVASGQGSRFKVGDLLFQKNVAGATEVIQITAISSDAWTVTRGYGSTSQASIADGATVARIPAAQEGSDIGADTTTAKTVRSNFTQIMFGGDLSISRTQLNRRMATDALSDQLGHELDNRAKELKRMMTNAFLYGVKSASAGSDSVYRTLGGLRYWVTAASGVTNTSATALSYANLNALANKPLVDKGKYVNTLLVGTDLMESIAGYDASNRRLLESDTVAGYTVHQIRLAQGNDINVIVDGRVNAGDAFLYDSADIRALPFNGAGMFVIAATDFADAKKRRIGCEWTLEVRHPEAMAYLSAKT